MNLADYLSELLSQHDEVSVPGLGYFVRTRVNAFYNENEGRFYPPYHQVKFTPEPKDDDTFVQYVADKKNISLASSKYFAEKFIGKLKEEAAKGKYLFADLGLFYTEQDRLIFKANDKIPADPAFYGYPQISLPRQGQPFLPEPPKPSFTEPAAPLSNPKPVVAPPAPVEVVPQQQYYEDEAEPKRGMSVWLIIVIALVVIAAALFGVYKFYPSAFDKARDIFNNLTHKTAVVTPVVRHEAKPDTANKTAVAPPAMQSDTSNKTVTPDTTSGSRFEVIASHSRFLARENADVERFKSEGLADSKIVLDAPGPFIKVSVGTYPTIKQADSAWHALIKAGKINKNSDGPLEIRPKK